MQRRVSSGGGGLDWRIVALGGAVVLALVVVVAALLFTGGGSAYAGTIEPDAGRTHIPDGSAGGVELTVEGEERTISIPLKAGGEA